MKSKSVISAAFLTMIVTMLLAGCKKTAEVEARDAVRVKEMTIVQGGGYHGESYSGTVEEESATLPGFNIGGTITHLSLRVGDRIRKGQLLATVDETQTRNAYDMAQSTLAQAEDALKRMRKLYEAGSLAEIKWVEVESKYRQAASAERIAYKNWQDCRLYAPVSGVVSEKYVEQGQNAAPGQPIVKIVSNSLLDVKISVPEGDVSAISLNDKALITVPSLKGRTYEGFVVEKGVTADALSRSYAVKIRVVHADKDLLPGMVTNVRLQNKSSRNTPAAVVLPARLLQLGDDNTFFVWVDNGGKAERRTVTTGEYTAEGVCILSGLKEGDKVIVEGAQKVSTGMKVTIR